MAIVTFHFRRVVPTLVGLAVLCLAGPAVAQQPIGTFRPDRPNRSIFGGGFGESEQRLIFTGQAGGGIGSSGTIGEAGDNDPEPRSSSAFGHFSGALDYGIERERFGLSGGIISATHYSPGAEGGFTTGNSGNGAFRLRLTRRTQVQANTRVALEPLSALSLVPGLDDLSGGATTPLDYGQGFGPESYLRYQASVGVSQAVSSRMDLGVSYYRNYAQYATSSANAGGGYLADLTYRVGRGLALRAGYGVDEVTVSGGSAEEPEERLRGHRMNLGVDFQRTLSISRRTALSLSTGSVVIDEQGDRYYEVVGTAALRRELGRTWFTSVAYDRDLTFVSVFAMPTFTESVVGSLSGLLGRRVSITSQAGGTRGRVGARADSNGYAMYQAGAGLSVGLTRELGIGLFYSYFRYRFDSAGALPEAFVQRELSGQAVRVGLDLFVPIFHRARRP